MRLLINQIARALMEHQTRDAQGRTKRHRMLLLLDEFPMLGRMPFFEVMMGAMAGYGLKASLVCQSLHHITKAYGRENVILDGWSINLQGMQGADPAGASGLSDRTDLHLDRLIGAIAMSAIVSVVANNAEDEDDGAPLSQNIADAAAQEAARTGGRIIDRELQVRPTLRVRAGAPVRVLVMRDIGLRPYRDDGHARR